jgi:DNA segregation ATPase FtsK/SpoIIIE-like protein
MAGKPVHTEFAAKKKTRRAEPSPGSPGSEFLAIVYFALSLFLVLCLFSYDSRDPSLNVVTARPYVTNLCGLVGSYTADALVQMLGLSALLVPLGLSLVWLRVFLGRGCSVGWSGICSGILLISGTSIILQRFSIGPFLDFPRSYAGGALGSFLHGSLFTLLGSAGEIVLASTLILLSFLHLSKVTVQGMTGFAMRALRWIAKVGKRTGTRLADFPWVRVEPRFDRGQPQGPQVTSETAVAGLSPPVATSPEWGVGEEDRYRTDPAIESWERVSCLPRDSSDGTMGQMDAMSGARENSSDDDLDAAAESGSHGFFPWRSLDMADTLPPSVSQPTTQTELEAAIDDYMKNELPPGSTESPEGSPDEPSEYPGHLRPIKVTRRADEEIARVEGTSSLVTDDDYKLPSVDLLDMPPTSTRSIDRDLLERNATILEQKLADLGIKGEVVEIHPGPVITMYELILAPGIPLRKVLNTSDDLAMALKSGSTRVVAPIPGKDTVGIEVPNLHREIVYFREIIESPAFMETTAPLKVALGKCIDGEPHATSLAGMPHLMIAGATGTGKSVGLNCLICSWLMSCHPDDVKFIMVDPKRLELSYYQNIPHLIHPVVTEAEKVPRVLSWAIREMERRYELLSLAGAKNIESYNKMIFSADPGPEAEEASAKKLPYIVIIVDELAELMMVAAKDIEISIARLAQMARAAGIHLILATQRPSVDVITGVIKANFPARISYQVSAKPDSRTILDTTGAEHLLGMGDMLFLQPGSAKLLRLHGAYVSENEIRRIVDFIKKQREPVYLQEIANIVSEADSSASAADLIDDEKYDEAVELVSRIGHASISLIQRHMRIGYNRAARIIEAMEGEGLIGPSDGTSRPREVLARCLESIPDGRG